MKKIYWWRILVFIIGGIGLIVGEILFYPYKYGLCISQKEQCLFGSLELVFAQPLFFISMALLIVSISLFFITDKIFLKWLRFALVWLGLTVVLVALAPVYTGGYVGFGPTKESVSIWMGSLFVIISLVKIVWDSRRAK